MTTYDIHAPVGHSGSGRTGRFKAAFMSMYRTMQHAQMLRVLSQCTDDQLAQMGITRQDISAHAHKCIFGADS